MNMPRTLAATAALFCLFASSLEAKSRTCRIVFPERPQEVPKSAYLFDGSKSQRVSLPSMNLSEVIELPSGDLTLAISADPIQSLEQVPPNAPKLRVPEKVTDFYIIVLHDPKNEDFPIKMNLVDTGGGRLKAGETLWYNFTEHRIVAKLGEATLSVAPMSRTISKGPQQASGYYSARFAYQPSGEGLLAPITEQHWWHDAQSRHLGFVIPSGGRLPRIFTFRDFRISL
jgi:hypothetical protein